MRVRGLFSGIGGLELGLERAGMEIVSHAEVDAYCARVLKKWWPNVPNLGDVTKVDWEAVRSAGGETDLVAGGFPCQPVSLAGKGLAQKDPRWLWPEFARAVRVLEPPYVLVENVPGLLQRGLGDVVGDLAELGYDAVWDRIPAAFVGAPHRRYRIWIFAAHPDRAEIWEQSWRRRRTCWAGEAQPGLDGEEGGVARPGAGVHPDPDRGRLQERGEPHVDAEQPELQAPLRHDVGGLRADVADADDIGRDGWAGFFGASGRAQPTDGGGAWTAEPAVGRVADGVPDRVARLKALGNAVVPQVSEWVGRRIMDYVAA